MGVASAPETSSPMPKISEGGPAPAWAERPTRPGTTATRTADKQTTAVKRRPTPAPSAGRAAGLSRPSESEVSVDQRKGGDPEAVLLEYRMRSATAVPKVCPGRLM